MALPGSQGKRSQLGLGAETDRACQKADTFRFLKVMNLQMKPVRPPEATKNMDPSGRPLKRRNEIVNLPIKFLLQPNVDDIALPSAHLRGYAAITSPTLASAPTVALAAAGAGNVENGVHYYKVTFVSVSGETGGGTASAAATVVVKTTDGKVALTAVALGPTGTTARKIYRTVAADPVTGTYKLLTTISDNTTAIYTDNTADASLGATLPTTTQPRVWSIRDLQTGDSLAQTIDTLSVEGDRDDGVAQLNLGVVLTGREIKIEKNKVVEVSFEGMSQHYTHADDPDMTTTGGTHTGDLYIRGNQAPSLADDLYIKCTTLGALDGTAKVKLKRTTAATYDGAEYAITANVWYDFIIEDDVTQASGDPLEPMQFMLSDGGTLSANDEWHIVETRTKYAATYSTRNLLSGAGVDIYVDGETTPRIIESCTIKTTVEKPERRGVGSKYPEGFVEGNPEVHEITLARKYTDRDFYNWLQTAEDIVVDVQMYGDPIGRGDYRELWRLVFNAVQVEDGGADASTPGPLPEANKPIAPGDPDHDVGPQTIHRHPPPLAS